MRAVQGVDVRDRVAGAENEARPPHERDRRSRPVAQPVVVVTPLLGAEEIGSRGANRVKAGQHFRAGFDAALLAPPAQPSSGETLTPELVGGIVVVLVPYEHAQKMFGCFTLAQYMPVQRTPRLQHRQAPALPLALLVGDLGFNPER